MRWASLAAAMFCLLALARPAAAEDRTLARIDTRAGLVEVRQVGNERRFLLNEKLVHTGTSFASITRFFRASGYDAMLIKDFTGPIECPGRYQFLALLDKGRYGVSPAFGECGHPPRLSVKGAQITAAFPAFGDLPARTYVFDGKEVRIEK